MFTGIIESTARILKNESGELTLTRPAMFDDIKEGSSISISGVCLTITKFDQEIMSFQMVEETLQKSSLGSKKEGDFVNLERAMAANGRFDGHIVQGHVEGVASVLSFIEEDMGKRLTLRVPQELMPFIVPKGSIALDGVSLTVTSTGDDTCSIALIPYTLDHTTLGLLKEGDAVNVETDVLVRAVLKNKS
jgi:riboflavin synthase